MDDLKEHFGTVIVFFGVLWGVVVVFAAVIWKQVRADLSKFPLWLDDVEKRGGVVTHNELLEEGPLMTSKSHEIICSRVVAQVATQITLSERHQREMMLLMEKEFTALLLGQGKLIERLENIQNIVLETFNKVKKTD